MKKNLIKTPCGLPIGEAVTTKDGEPGLEIQRGGVSETVTLTYVMEQIQQKIKSNKIYSRKTERGA